MRTTDRVQRPAARSADRPAARPRARRPVPVRTAVTTSTSLALLEPAGAGLRHDDLGELLAALPPGVQVPRPVDGVARRALLSVALLAGVYVVSLLAFLAVWTVFVLVVADGLRGRGVAALGILALAVTVALVQALRQATRGTRLPDADPEVLATRQAEPRLWAELDALAAAAGTRAPDEVRIDGRVNASVRSNSSFLGLREGRRVLTLGLPLLQGLDVPQLRAVLAHETGHYAGGDTRLAPLAYRGRLAVSVLAETMQGSLLGPVFGAYAHLVLRVSLGVGRRQELAADALAAKVTSPATIGTALYRLAAVSLADAQVDAWLDPLVKRGRRPANRFEGVRLYLAAEADRCEEASAGRLGTQEPDPLSTHPTTAQRIAALRELPATAPDSLAGHGLAARTLLADPEAWERRLTARGLVPAVRALDEVSWQDAGDALAPVAAWGHDLGRAVAAVAADVDGLAEEPADAGTVLDVLGDPPSRRSVRALLGQELAADASEQRRTQYLQQHVAGWLTALVTATGGHRHLQWTGEPVWQDAHGVLDIDRWNDGLCGVSDLPASTVADELLDRLHGDTTWTPPRPGPCPPSVEHAEPWHQSMGLQTRGVRSVVLLLTEEGLVLVRSKGAVGDLVASTLSQFVPSVGNSRSDRQEARMEAAAKAAGVQPQALAGAETIPWTAITEVRSKNRSRGTAGLVVHVRDRRRPVVLYRYDRRIDLGKLVRHVVDVAKRKQGLD